MRKCDVMRSRYKDAYNEWAHQFYVVTGSDPSAEDAEGFRDDWLESQYDLADRLRKEERENPK